MSIKRTTKEWEAESQALAYKIRTAREVLGYTLVGFAEYIGISASTIKLYESNATTVSVWYLSELAEKLHIRIEDFLMDVPEFVLLLYGRK